MNELRTYLNSECRSRFKLVSLIPDEKTGDKNLVYAIAGRDSNYVTMLGLLLESLHHHTPNPNFDFLVICDEESKPLVENLPFGSLKLFITTTSKISEPHELVRSLKWSVAECPELSAYRKVLFLDDDILINQDLNRVFEHELNDNRIYGMVEKESQYLHEHPYFGFNAYTPEDLEKIKELGIKTLNGGQFLFLNTSAMRQHLRNLIWLQDNWKFEQLGEQSAFNHYFNLNLASDTKLLAEHFTINVDRSIPYDSTKNVHFAGNMGCSQEKLDTMRLNLHHQSLMRVEPQPASPST